MATTRKAGLPQAALLIFTSCLSVLATVLIAPVLPRIEAHYPDVAGVAVLTPILLTLPALVVALLAPLAGNIVVRSGRKPLLLAGLALYAAAGTVPLWLDDFHLILLSRLLLGVGEAAVMTCCTTLIADYYDGAKRARFLSYQAVATSLSASFIVYLGGLLGEAGWQAPFALYAIGLILLPLAQLTLWEPGTGDAAADRPSATGEHFPWARVLPIYGFAFVAMLGFFVIPIQGPYLLTELGINSPEQIGRVIGANQFAVFLSALSTAWMLQRLGYARLLGGAIVLTGASFLLLSLANSVPLIVFAMVLTGIGCGVMIPTSMAWTVSQLSFVQRPRGVGGATSCLFFGQFMSPVMLMGLAALLGTRMAAIGVWGVVALVVGVLAWLYGRRTEPGQGAVTAAEATAGP